MTDLNLTNFLYYFGWGLAFLGLISFLGVGSISYGRRFSNIFTPLYGIVFWWTGNQFWSADESNTFSGLLITLALLMIPLSFYSWMDQDLPNALTRVLMELSLLVGSLMAIFYYPGFSFFISLVGLAIWGFSLDLVISLNLGAGAVTNYSQTNLQSLQTKRVSEVFGLLMIYTAYLIDDHYPDYAFWLYLFGLTSSWLGLTTESGNSEIRKFIYACLNLALILIWAFVIDRHIFLFWGVVGVNLYQGHSLIYDGLLESSDSRNSLKINYRIIYNLLVIVTASLLDRYSVLTPILDLTFWMYLHGGFLLWVNQTIELFKQHTLATDQTGEEKVWLVFLLFSISYIIVSLYLTRIIFLLCGLIGVISYLVHLGQKYFPSSLVFTGSLILLGVTLMFFSHQIRIYYGIF